MNSNILNVLVVDDEIPIREELSLFNWEESGAKLVGEAENGVEALEFCREYTPHVVITDITMPVMNGLELLERLKQDYPQIQVVLLTCHSEFGYARKALQLGALDYLIKGVFEDEELAKILRKAEESIERNRTYLKSSREESRWKQSKIISRLVNGEYSKLHEINDELLASELIQAFPTRLVHLQMKTNKNDILFVDREVQFALDEMEQEGGFSFTWSPIRNGEYLLLDLSKKENVDQVFQQLEKLINFINTQLVKNLSFVSDQVSIFAVISDSIGGVKDLLTGYNAISKCCEYSFYEEERKIFIGKAPLFSSLNEEKLDELIGAIQRVEKNNEQVSFFFNKEFYEWALKHKFSPTELKELVLKWIIEWQRKWGLSDILELSECVFNASSLTEMISLIVYSIETCLNKKNQIRPEIRHALRFMNEHFSEPITLSVVAAKVGYSIHYLSRIFREEMGESFNEYLTRIRMEYAIKLLQSSNLKVYEVAEKVGIPNYRYFSVVFRKWTGITPTDYKRG